MSQKIPKIHVRDMSCLQKSWKCATKKKKKTSNTYFIYTNLFYIYN